MDAEYGGVPEAGQEPKWLACNRLKREGRYIEFRRLVSFFRSRHGGQLPRDMAFYAALEKFPPLAEGDDGRESAAEVARILSQVPEGGRRVRRKGSVEGKVAGERAAVTNAGGSEGGVEKRRAGLSVPVLADEDLEGL